MLPLETLYQEHAELLRSRGFDDKTLGKLFRQGWLFEELKRCIGQALVTSGSLDEPVGFTLKAVGGLNDMTDIVAYQLHYLLRPDPATLDLYQLDVQWGAHQSRYKLQTSYDLPSATQALRKLKKEAGLKKYGGQPLRVNFPKKPRARRGKGL